MSNQPIISSDEVCSSRWRQSHIVSSIGGVSNPLDWGLATLTSTDATRKQSAGQTSRDGRLPAELLTHLILFASGGT